MSRAGVPMRTVLFGEVSLRDWTGGAAADREPWTSFARVRRALQAGDDAAAVRVLRTIAGERTLESRHHVVAWRALRGLGVLPDAAEATLVLGVVVEVGLPGGSDCVSGYADGTARYLNQGGGSVVWDAPDASLRPRIESLLAHAKEVAARVGVWESALPPPPPNGEARVNVLTPGALRFGTAPTDSLARDGTAGPVFSAAYALMVALVALFEKRGRTP